MKIAVATDDGQLISSHFGRAAMYAVLTVEDGAIVARELRPKAAPHGQADASPDAEPRLDGAAHGTGAAARDKHDAMLAPVGDCAYVITRGMGQGAHDHIVAAGIRPIVTDLHDIDEAAIECASGRIVDHSERLH